MACIIYTFLHISNKKNWFHFIEYLLISAVLRFYLFLKQLIQSLANGVWCALFPKTRNKRKTVEIIMIVTHKLRYVKERDGFLVYHTVISMKTIFQFIFYGILPEDKKGYF